MRHIRPSITLVLCLTLGATLGRTADSADGAAPEKEIVKLGRVTVEEQRLAPYAATDAAQVGPLGSRALLDTPFSISVMSGALIENLQAVVPDDLFKVNPVTQLSTPQSRFFSAATLRGFSLGSTKRIDCIPSSNTYVNVDLEDKERVEILTGLSGFLNGAGNVGGSVNYTLKRPTSVPLNRVTLGLNGGENGYVHGDFSGPLGAPRMFGYRLNVVTQDGDTAVDHQSIHRQMASGAFDWQATRTLRFQFDASYSHYLMHGTEPYWSTTTGIAYPAAPDATRYFGQPFTFTETRQHHVGAGLTWQLRPGLTLRAAAVRRESAMGLAVTNNTFIAGAPGTYKVQASQWEYPDVTAFGGYAFIDGEFETGLLSHRVTAGYYGDSDQRTNFRSSAGGWATLTYAEGFHLAQPVYLNTPPPAPTGAKYTANKSRYHNLVLGDDVRLGQRWSALVGVNRATIDDRALDAAGAVSGTAYNESKVTPTYALLFKPVPAVSTYLSYMESFEKGGTAGSTYGGYPVVNANATLSPLTSEQFEAGLKARWRDAFFTVAFFSIDKGLQYYDVSTPSAPVYVQDGREVHRGFEFTVSGDVLKHLTVIAGLTAFNAETREQKQTPALVGKAPANVAEHTAKLYAEYALPPCPGLALTGGIYYTGPQFVDAANTDRLPSFVTGDVGLRYTTQAVGHPVTLRANVTNVTQENYWLTAFYVGPARTLRLSATFDF